MRERSAGSGTVLWLGAITLLLFGGGGVVLIAFAQHRDPIALILGPRHWMMQGAMGVCAGGAIATVAAWLIDRPFMEAIRTKYVELIGGIVRSRSDVVFISICAGVGEELFFRGAVQHWLGVPLTAVLFVAIHGYIDPRSWRMSTYGLVMSLGMMALGWMADRLGLLSAMMAHALIDVVLLVKLARARERTAQS